MAARMAKDLRSELEEMMQEKMKDMFTELEERLVKAGAAGQAPVNQSCHGSQQASQELLIPEDPSGGAHANTGPLNLEDTPLSAALDLDEMSRPYKRELGSAGGSSYDGYKRLSGSHELAMLDDSYDMTYQATHKDDAHFKMNIATLLMLLLAACADIFEVDCQARQSTDNFPLWYKALQIVLCMGFLAELVARVRSKGWEFFILKAKKLVEPGARSALVWNYFQTILVVAQVTEVTMILGEWWFGWPRLPIQLRMWFRMLSVLRILRAFNILDQLDCTAELHLLLASMDGSLSSLSWSALFIIIPMYVFGMAITQFVAEFRINSDIEENQLDDIMRFFGSLDRSMLTLFWAIAGGISWSEATEPLADYEFVWTSFAFALYIAAMSFATLNVLTGVFVNSATAAASSETSKRALHTLQKIFVEVDLDKSGNLSHSEFKQLLRHQEIEVCLQSLDIRPEQASHLFHLVDSDKSEVVEIEELLKGCDRLQGNLKAIDFATFLLDFERFKAEVQAAIGQMNGGVGQSASTSPSSFK